MTGPHRTKSFKLGLPSYRPCSPCCENYDPTGPFHAITAVRLRLRPDGSAFCPRCGRSYDLVMGKGMDGNYGYFLERGDPK